MVIPKPRAFTSGARNLARTIANEIAGCPISRVLCEKCEEPTRDERYPRSFAASFA